NVADRGESCLQRRPRVLGADQRLLGYGYTQLLVAKVGIESKVCMRVNQARQKRGVGQLDDVCRRLSARSGPDNLAILNYHPHVIQGVAGFHIQHVAGMDYGYVWSRFARW